MENRLRTLFDVQRFQGNKRLAKMIADAENDVAAELTDDELFMVSAAGEPSLPKREETDNDI